ncbi:cation transporting P-ATPase, putative [Plasmodium knowlesi strain H]|uniref:Cation transporting P-ATPase, putative n=3 Tax=Plasmodium knowlesi TaxID=5850 RepID=A0A5K1URY6_PLAKH|nr:cation transporting P-ATPase, putative [Plasmodium knowlesi strain H]OTN67101.1 putative Cation transporting P-ATPase [Plasmodium knowlesi]CAA9988800.1 cation transporting P-ATPase, putative [Plasmodium knowlesi strain H]SBO21777.1 cation transporting P-ATPase, putative [Plasmodium knowlesi strain H]SBO22160.1 cation transporting P-ATPase, putative [Plasmodium knowlesi strain H]VVS78274.1 cation transporting P-ATPase, putative [Plasmodium knowlesi strain H]|eukprot:XP_002259777.1 P-type ATPase, putative [Plasmodium knowlesi strain H]
MGRVCKADSLPLTYSELTYICFFYLFLLISFLVWCVRKNRFRNQINERHKWKNTESHGKNENVEFFNYIFEQGEEDDSDDIVVRQEGYQNSFVGFALKNASIFLYVCTHIIIVFLIANEYCIHEGAEIFWNDRAFIFFIFLLLCFSITYGILTVRKHLQSFFLKPSLLKESDYVLIYTRSDDYANRGKSSLRRSFFHALSWAKRWYHMLGKRFRHYANVYMSYQAMIKRTLFLEFLKWSFIHGDAEFGSTRSGNSQEERCHPLGGGQKDSHHIKYEDILEDTRLLSGYTRKGYSLGHHEKGANKIAGKATGKTGGKAESRVGNKAEASSPPLTVHKIKVQINEKNMRYFFFRSMKYVYNEEKDAFHNIAHTIEEKVQSLDFNYLLKKGGLNNSEIINNLNDYGYNNIHLEFCSFFKSIKRELLDGIYMFQLFITYKNFFWKEMITSLIWLVISFISVVNKIMKNQKNKREIYDNIQSTNNTVVTVYRNSIVQHVPSSNLTIGDVIIINSKMTMPCDCLLLTGQVLVDESLLTGESRPMKKTCISNLSSFNSFNNRTYSSSSDSFSFGGTSKEKKQQWKNTSPHAANPMSGNFTGNTNHEKFTKGKYQNAKRNFHQNNILYSGTDIISTMNSTESIYAVVISVSIYTYKGKYMQNVLFPNPLLFKYDSQLPIVFLFTILFSLICMYFQIRSLGFNMTSIFYTIGTMSQILPVWTPVVLNMGLNISTNRLKEEKNIRCIAPSRIPICGKIRIFFFDKTGTLTGHKIEFSGVHFSNNVLNEQRVHLSALDNHSRSVSDDTYDVKYESYYPSSKVNMSSVRKNGSPRMESAHPVESSLPHGATSSSGGSSRRDKNFVAPESQKGEDHLVTLDHMDGSGRTNEEGPLAEMDHRDEADRAGGESVRSLYSSVEEEDFPAVADLVQAASSANRNEGDLALGESGLVIGGSGLVVGGSSLVVGGSSLVVGQMGVNTDDMNRVRETPDGDEASQLSSGDVFQSYDETDENKNLENQEKDISPGGEEEHERNPDDGEHIEGGNLSTLPNDEMKIFDEEPFLREEVEQHPPEGNSISIDMDTDESPKRAKKEKENTPIVGRENASQKSAEEEAEQTEGEEAPMRSCHFNESNSSMNSVTSLLYNSKLMWANKATLKNTPPSYHLLVYALAGCACVYSDTNTDNVYGHEIDKRLFEATEMKISNYINKHNMNVKKVSLKINYTYKYFDILKTFEFDYFTKISTTLAYGYFDFGEKIFVVFSKGSFDKIYKKCIKNEEIQFFKKKEQEYSKNGFYVIGLAFRIICGMSFQEILQLPREELEKDMSFLSLIMFSNYIKKDAELVVQTLKSSSIRPVILTGDNAYNCLYVGNKIGLFNSINFYESFLSINMNSNTNTSSNSAEKILNERENLFLSTETKFLSFENFIKSNAQVGKGDEESVLGTAANNFAQSSHQQAEYHADFYVPQREGTDGFGQRRRDGALPIGRTHTKGEEVGKVQNNNLFMGASSKIYRDMDEDYTGGERTTLIQRGQTSAKGGLENGHAPPHQGSSAKSRNSYNSVDEYKADRGSEDRGEEEPFLEAVSQMNPPQSKNSYYIYEQNEQRSENVIIYGYVQEASSDLIFVNIQNDKRVNSEEVLFGNMYKEIILTGEAYTYIKHTIFHISNEEEDITSYSNFEKSEGYKNFLLRVRIFSRLTPNNKMDIIKDFIKYDYISGMCGDGSNDCGALKISHAGLALSDADTSVVSPFSSKNENIKSVIDVLREGRACLVTSINCYKYMLLYGFMISVVKIVLFMNAHAVMSEYGYLFFDNVILLLLAKSMTLSRPARKLKTQTPTSSIIGAQTIISLLSNLVVNFFFLYIIMVHFFYVYELPSSYDMNSSAPKSSWWLMSDNYESFLACVWFCFQIVNSAFIFTFGGKYRKSIFSNYTFMGYYCLINSFLFYLTVGGPNRLTCLFRMNCNDEVSRKTKFKILDLFSYSASGLSFYGPNGNNILTTGHKIKFLFLNFLNIAVNICISKYVLCEPLYNMVRRFFNFQNRKVPV